MKRNHASIDFGVDQRWRRSGFSRVREGGSVTMPYTRAHIRMQTPTARSNKEASTQARKQGAESRVGKETRHSYSHNERRIGVSHQ